MMSTNLDNVGYIEDGDYFDDYREGLEDYIQLLLANDFQCLNDFVSWILSNQIKCLIVDHDLHNKYRGFVGTDIIAYLNKHLTDLPCMILTSFKDRSINENLVISTLIKDRDEVIKDGDFSSLGNELKQACIVFDKRLEKNLIEYENLYKKKHGHNISTEEEEELITLYKILRAYEVVDEIPAELLKSEISNKMDNLLSKLDKCINKKD